jgi:hypothetical protein
MDEGADWSLRGRIPGLGALSTMIPMFFRAAISVFDSGRQRSEMTAMFTNFSHIIGHAASTPVLGDR